MSILEQSLSKTGFLISASSYKVFYIYILQHDRIHAPSLCVYFSVFHVYLLPMRTFPLLDNASVTCVNFLLLASRCKIQTIDGCWTPGPVEHNGSPFSAIKLEHSLFVPAGVVVRDSLSNRSTQFRIAYIDYFLYLYCYLFFNFYILSAC